MKQLALSTIVLAVCVVVSGCEATFNTYGKKALEYPSHWGDPRIRSEQRLCPVLSGTYLDTAVESSWSNWQFISCKEQGEDCSLSHYLLNKALFLKLSNNVPKIHDWPTATHVQLIQVGDEELEIVTWDDGRPGTVVKTRNTLRQKDGDFSCDERGLWLRNRSDDGILGIANFAARESRLFNITNDGTLTMFKDRSVMGNVLLVPHFVTNAFWLRWAPSQ